ncbi:dolichol-phosphate mannosyltransferase [Marivirga tractuosa]|uniref:Dolichyl-phosphate beta-D-mannosyltransferase n=1 Tax=Marivirga tractuosa (strain ATCC 23168 / DSM 4126 / NBRC 15989 / NCIMB 1408 / VKM B-1430 / H-43) TaxID=643867 RepID=E4TQL8_MARTH|nr:polyprenol monophosphomannose synthase [Marivirga tractuosa]ADR23711.1 Dolichyl-phosphate beta-D-mannosyltransferase [Marivirga tractuosa DSM 4126]BDD15608.1 dolichol-phosphate mannosyltransferase [Marivirga tractuosa]
MKDNLVIIPTYNECENIEDIIRAVFLLSTRFEILIIDDNSPDGTAEIVKALQEEYEGQLHIIKRSGKLGLGTAYIEGFRYALKNNYQYIFEMDADFSHNPLDLLELLKSCEKEEVQLSIGSRYKTGVNVVNWPMGRVLMSYMASKYVRFITGLPVYDATAGFICYHRSVLETIELDKIKFIGYAFQIEMKFTAWKHGFGIEEVPIIFTDRSKGTSKMSKKIFKEAIFGVIQMKVNSWFKKYKQIGTSISTQKATV